MMPWHLSQLIIISSCFSHMKSPTATTLLPAFFHVRLKTSMVVSLSLSLLNLSLRVPYFTVSISLYTLFSSFYIYSLYAAQILLGSYLSLSVKVAGVSAVQMRRSMSFSGVGSKCEEVHGDDDMSDDGSQLGEKKKRLNMEQVKALERSFELGNKLEPERKMQLARALGLQPRQVAIWFQNRRARWKTKQLEKDYDLLKRRFEALKADNDALHAQNNKLHAELLTLKGMESTGNGPINLNKETDQGSWSNASDNSCEFNLATTRPPATDRPLLYSTQSNKPIFHPSMVAATNVNSHLLQSSSRSELLHHHQYQKIDHQVAPADESFCKMFSAGMDEQSGFWPWP